MNIRTDRFSAKFSLTVLFLLSGGAAWAAGQGLQQVGYYSAGISLRPGSCYLSTKFKYFPAFVYQPVNGEARVVTGVPKKHILSPIVKKHLEDIVAQEGKPRAQREVPNLAGLEGIDIATQRELARHIQGGSVSFEEGRRVLAVDRSRLRR